MNRIVPTNGATRVSINTSIEVEFSKAVDPVTAINGTSFSLVDAALPGNPLSGTITFDGTGKVLRLEPTVPLDFDVSYIISMTADIFDSVGKPLDFSKSGVPVPSSFRTQLVPDSTLINTPSPPLKAMVLPAPLDNPPIRLSVELTMLTPALEFPKAVVPLMSVPIKLP